MMKKICVASQLTLLAWFFLDMTGLSFGNACLVERSYKDDGVFFVIYLAAVILFALKDKIGKWAVAIWASMWFITQFLCHEWYTIFGKGIMGSLEGKFENFSDKIQLFTAEGRYFPDLYHSVLHLLILVVIITTVIFICKGKRTAEENDK